MSLLNGGNEGGKHLLYDYDNKVIKGKVVYKVLATKKEKYIYKLEEKDEIIKEKEKLIQELNRKLKLLDFVELT